MKWLNDWFVRRCRAALAPGDEKDYLRPGKESMSSMSPVRTPDGPGITFVVYPAHGGTIVEVRTYDSIRNTPQLHIVTKDQDLGQAISHLITYTTLAS